MNLRVAAVGKARNECRILTQERLGKWTFKLDECLSVHRRRYEERNPTRCYTMIY